MCGIVGYVGTRECSHLLLEGLKRLEYRGYDSAGLAVVKRNGSCQLRRAAGKLVNLEQTLRTEPVEGTTGIGHTRWATHGKPTQVNAHPHRADDIVVVHNGIIENHIELKDELVGANREFTSETDTEIISHLVAREKAAAPRDTLVDWTRRALSRVRGSFAIAVMDTTDPDSIVAAKNASPLVVGLGEGENFVASDIPAILAHTRQVLFLGEGQIAKIGMDGVEVLSINDGEPIDIEPTHITWSPAMAEKGGYKHFMLKEIHEQPRAVTDTIRGRVSLEQARVRFEDVTLTSEEIGAFNRIVVIACGTSWHAATVGKYTIESLARVPVEVDLASEFRYRDPLLGPDTLVVTISQSGETADTLAALKLAKEKDARVLSICNVVGSSIPRHSDDVIYTHAGPEIGVASTKAFTTQLAAMYLLAVHVAQCRSQLSDDDARTLLQELVEVPNRMEELLQGTEIYDELARRFAHSRDVLYLGRGNQFPMALEGALKLKEISYIHAEGYASGEMKHGPIALIDEDVPSVFVIPRDRHFEKNLSNLAEIRARGGSIIAVATEGDMDVTRHAEFVLTVPDVSEHLMPLMTAIPMQLIAYTIADFKGTDVDQPRNLAKSVTVE